MAWVEMVAALPTHGKHRGQANGRGPLFKVEGRAWLALRRVAAVSHLTWIKRKISFSSTVIGVGRMALRRFREMSMIETGNESKGGHMRQKV
jgi:hypothetical protein